jgi:hypothetical protein
MPSSKPEPDGNLVSNCDFFRKNGKAKPAFRFFRRSIVGFQNIPPKAARFQETLTSPLPDFNAPAFGQHYFQRAASRSAAVALDPSHLHLNQSLTFALSVDFHPAPFGERCGADGRAKVSLTFARVLSFSSPHTTTCPKFPTESRHQFSPFSTARV